MSNFPIGIFDSGLGGLTVQRAIAALLPHEDTIYLGDTAHVPYGTKSRETVTRYSLDIADYLSKSGIKLLVVACNTASAYSIGALRERLNIPVIGVIEPGASAAVEATQTGRIGVIGTEGTVRSGAYFDAIKKRDDRILVFLKACPLFVPLAEEGMLDNRIAALTAMHYLKYFKEEPVDTLVLGCTHYPLLKEVVGLAMPEGTALIDSAEATAHEVQKMLISKGLIKTHVTDEPKHSFYVTDSPERFMSVGKNFLGEPFSDVKLIHLIG